MTPLPNEILQVGLVGAGQVGSTRAAVVSEDPMAALAVVADVQEERAREVAARWGAGGCHVTTDWQEVVASPDLDVVIISTVNKFLAPISIAALQSGKHVLCEKPMARNLVEAQQMAEAAQSAGKLLKIGFNHRYYPAISKAHELCVKGEVGPLFFIRCIYGHGGRADYEKEWRGDPDLAGGGELLDQGVHIADLCRWFLGDFAEVYGVTATYFWNLGYFPSVEKEQSFSVRNPKSEIRNQLEDNAFAILRTASGQVAFWHTSWTQWKNCFLLEICGRDGYVRVEGRGGSYGLQRLTLGRRRPESGPPEEEVWEFPGSDVSWEAEWADFAAAIREGRRPMGDEKDGLQAMRLIDAIYRSAREGYPVSISL
jgi:predicted dehydrogenase